MDASRKTSSKGATENSKPASGRENSKRKVQANSSEPRISRPWNRTRAQVRCFISMVPRRQMICTAIGSAVPRQMGARYVGTADSSEGAKGYQELEYPRR